jgi:cytochrome b involved in lipid metabolism
VNFFQKIKKNQTNQHTKTNTRNTYHRFTSCTQSLQQQQQQQQQERTSLIIIMFKKKPFAKAVQSKSDNPRLFFVGLVCVILLYIYRALLLSSSSSKSKKKKKKEEMVVVDKTRKISAEEVRKHNSVDDLWIIIDKKVYDVTEYAEEHPGGVAAIAKNAGGDASKGFRGPQHPSRVFDIVDDYMIGVLEEKK